MPPLRSLGGYLFLLLPPPPLSATGAMQLIALQSSWSFHPPAPCRRNMTLDWDKSSKVATIPKPYNILCVYLRPISICFPSHPSCLIMRFHMKDSKCRFLSFANERFYVTDLGLNRVYVIDQRYLSKSYYIFLAPKIVKNTFAHQNMACKIVLSTFSKFLKKSLPY